VSSEYSPQYGRVISSFFTPKNYAREAIQVTATTDEFIQVRSNFLKRVAFTPLAVNSAHHSARWYRPRCFFLGLMALGRSLLPTVFADPFWLAIACLDCLFYRSGVNGYHLTGFLNEDVTDAAEVSDTPAR
jgi:hypothetical protein